MGLKREKKESREERAERIMDGLSEVKIFNYSYIELKNSVDIKKKIFLFLLLINLVLSLMTLYQIFKPTIINLYSSSYTAEIEKLTQLRTVEENGKIYLNYKINDRGTEKNTILELSKESLKGL